MACLQLPFIAAHERKAPEILMPEFGWSLQRPPVLFAHADLDVLPTLVVVSPVGQLVQDVLPVSAWNLPAEQLVQLLAAAAE